MGAKKLAKAAAAMKDSSKEAKSNGKEKGKEIAITRPETETVAFGIRGTSPLVQNKFGLSAMNKMMEVQKAGSTAKSKSTKRTPKDFDALYKEALHIATEGWYGIPASAFRNAMVSACRVCGYVMAKAKLSIFIQADGYSNDGTALVRITHGEPHPFDAVVRISNNTTDIRRRPMFDPGWEALVKITFDKGLFTVDDMFNLLMRVGLQVGIGEGRNDSKTSTGMGWGSFEMVNVEQMVKVE